jgi:phenazine biosynthesis protein phzE
MRLLAAEVDLLLAARKPFIAVCLSHQILCGRLGITVRPLWRPNQGTQREITVFGERARVGFYNSFAGFCDFDEIHPHGFDVPVTVNRDAATGEIHLLRGPGFVSWQFHPESVLSPDGVRVIDTALSVLLPDPRPSI